MKAKDEPSSPAQWLLLVHQLPAKPAYLRVKVWRRLQALGAVTVKNSVYVLPAGERAQEDFEWMLKQVVGDGGEGMICEARLVDGLSDQEVRALFNKAREADYDAIASSARELRETLARIVARHRRFAPTGHERGATWRSRRRPSAQPCPQHVSAYSTCPGRREARCRRSGNKKIYSRRGPGRASPHGAAPAHVPGPRPATTRRSRPFLWRNSGRCGGERAGSYGGCRARTVEFTVALECRYRKPVPGADQRHGPLRCRFRPLSPG
jgi:hypothetical protein